MQLVRFTLPTHNTADTFTGNIASSFVPNFSASSPLRGRRASNLPVQLEKV